jgi:probable phosphomutase (TIGR03848 family)
MATVLLVRHGRTSANASGILAGWTPGVHLDEAGREQAHRVGARLAEAQIHPVRVVSSPLVRCLDTAGIVLATCSADQPVVPDDRLGECRYGAWTGRPLAELAKEPLWRVVQDHPSAAVFPDGPDHPGESMAQMSTRAVAAVRQVDASVTCEYGASAIWLAVSHGDVIKAVLADALGLHIDAFQRIAVDPGSVSAVRYTPGRPAVLKINQTDGLDGLLSTNGPGQAGDAPVGGGAGTVREPRRG